MVSNKFVFLLAACFLAMSPGVHCDEQFEQETLSIRGNQALPKTLYIAPWKRLGGPLEGREFEGEVSEKLDPVERELFRRELELHREGYILE